MGRITEKAPALIWLLAGHRSAPDAPDRHLALPSTDSNPHFQKHQIEHQDLTGAGGDVISSEPLRPTSINRKKVSGHAYLFHVEMGSFLICNCAITANVDEHGKS